MLAVGNALEYRSQRDLGLAESDVAAEKSVHGIGLLHILFNFIYAAELIIRLDELKTALKIVLHINVG